MRRLAVLAAAVLLLPACRSGPSSAPEHGLTVMVSAPISTSPWIAESITQGADLAIQQINAAGGIQVGKQKWYLRAITLDNRGSVERALSDARSAVAKESGVLITDGVGAVSVAGVTGPAKLATFITFEGGEDLIDEEARPTLFRMAPANKPMTVRLTDYIAARKPKIALLTDDTGYGRDGRRDLTAAIRRDKLTLVKSIELATGADPAPQVLAAQRSGADTVLLWARAPVVASVVTAMRSRGWQAPVWTGPTAEDPLLRQQLAQHPEWLRGVGFVSFRMTAEVGPKPFETFRAAYEKKYGADKIGVGDVVQPPDWAMYAYDTVYLLAKALTVAKGLGQPLLDAFNAVSVTGANGDERSFLPRNHEGVSSDDMYIARFEGMRFVPVKDDILSASLPVVPQ